MNILLDTHVFLWYISGDQRLPIWMRDAVRASENDVYLSVVSLWEAIIKYQLGKLPLPESPERYLPVQRDQHQISSLSLDESSVSRLAELPPIHRDPFDRIMICQAMELGLTIATVDGQVRAYSVPILQA